MIFHYIKEALDLKKKILEDKEFHASVNKAIEMINACYTRGNKMLVAGNGGSAADAQHFVAEIVSGYKNFERKGYPAISLTTDPSVVTAWSNDKHFDTLFARNIEALGQKGDIFLAISTSGNSRNLIKGAEKARELGIQSIAFLGKDGGALRRIVDHSIVVPSDNTPRIQEVHALLTHMICEEVEKTSLI